MLPLAANNRIPFRGDRLRSLREEKKLTQEELGKAINVTKVSISGYENSNRNPDIETLHQIADYFEVSSDYLMGRSDVKNPEKKPDGRFFYDLDHASDEDLDKLEEFFKFLQSQKENKDK